MSDTDRRGFLRGGLRAALLGTGGLLLPMQGRTLLSFPNAAGLPDIPVIAQPFIPSPELLELRRIVMAQVAARRIELPRGHPGRHGGPGHPFYELAMEYDASSSVRSSLTIGSATRRKRAQTLSPRVGSFLRCWRTVRPLETPTARSERSGRASERKCSLSVPDIMLEQLATAHAFSRIFRQDSEIRAERLD